MTIALDLSSRATRRLLGVCAVLLAFLVAGLGLTSQAGSAPGPAVGGRATGVESALAPSRTPVHPDGASQTRSTPAGSRGAARAANRTPAPAVPVAPASPGQPAVPVLKPEQPEATARPAQPAAPAAQPTQVVAPPARPVKPTRTGAPLKPDRPRLVPVRPGAARPPVATPERPPSACVYGPGRYCPDPAPVAPTW